MSDMENNEMEEETPENASAENEYAIGSYEAELAQFAVDVEKQVMMENEVSLSEDLTGFAKGFPDWDLHPPVK